jgi:hypothetical protein
MTTILIHLIQTAIILAVLYPLVLLVLRICKPASARLHRFAWGGVLVIPFFAMTLPVAVPVAVVETAEEQSRNRQIAEFAPTGQDVYNPRPAQMAWQPGEARQKKDNSPNGALQDGGSNAPIGATMIEEGGIPRLSPGL